METDEEITGFLEEPIKGWGKWFVALSPYLFMILLLGYSWLDDINSPVDLAFLQTIMMIMIWGCICVFFIAPFVGLAHNLPGVVYPATGFLLCFPGAILFIVWLFLVEYEFLKRVEFASELIDEIFSCLQNFIVLLAINFVLCLLVTLLAIWKRRSDKIMIDTYQNVLWLFFLLYCSTLLLPILGIFEFITSEIMLIIYVPLGLGTWTFLRLPSRKHKYLVLIISTFLEYGLGALVLYESYQMHVPGYDPDLPFWLPALIMAIEGLMATTVIALPAALEFLLYLRSVVEEEGEPAPEQVEQRF
ncbi:MAG: hypothetical protein JXB38_02835 [Anaerolineales bacterium]|nr:hypothetical protein [Anaerolineales bacterium]